MSHYVAVSQSTNEVPNDVKVWIKEVRINYTILLPSAANKVKMLKLFRESLKCIESNATMRNYSTNFFSLCTACLWLLMNMCAVCGSFRLRCCLMCGVFAGWTSGGICYIRTDSLINPPHLSHCLTTCIHMHMGTPSKIKLRCSPSPLKIQIMISNK